MNIRLRTIAAGVALAGALAWGQTTAEVCTANAVGFVNVTLPPTGGCVFAAVNFKALAGGDLTLDTLWGTNLLMRDDVYARADKIYLWNAAAQTFMRYAQKPSGAFCRQEQWLAGGATNPALTNGTGFWLQSPSLATNARTFRLMGEVAADVVYSNRMYPGYQGIGAPFADALALTNNDWLADGAVGSDVMTNADRIIVWNGSGFDRYGLATNGLWYNWTNWIGQGGSPVDLSLALGEGAWYVSMTNTTWTWTQSKLYEWP